VLLKKKLKIGKIEVSPIIPAPLAGYTDSPYRRILKLCGADLVCAPLLPVEAIARQKIKTIIRDIKFDESERPIMFQFFGYKPESFVIAINKVIEYGYKPDIININLGCSVKKILRAKSGGYLLKEPQTIYKIVEEILKNITIPLTVKIRAGWNNENINYLQISQQLEKICISAIFFHPRTVSELFKNQAKWEYIKILKENVKIPVIGNGDIKRIEDAEYMINMTNCDGIMVGRAIIGNPFFITYLNNYLIDGNKFFKIDLTKLFNTIKIHINYAREFYESENIISFRKHLFKYLKGMKQINKYRERINKLSKANEFIKLIDEIAENEKI